MSTESWTWRMEEAIPSDTSAGKPIVERLLSELGADGWDPHDLFSVHLAVEEALVNAIAHGNQHDPNKQVRISCKLAPDRLWVQISDEGDGFNPSDVPDPTAPENLDSPSGRGLLLIRNYMTTVEFSDNGRTVIMEKHREAPGDELEF